MQGEQKITTDVDKCTVEDDERDSVDTPSMFITSSPQERTRKTLLALSLLGFISEAVVRTMICSEGISVRPTHVSTKRKKNICEKNQDFLVPPKK